MSHISGILSALITPFDKDGRVNTAVLRDLVRFQLEAGLAGFFVNGGTGEGLLLDSDERKQILEIVLDEVAGKAAVIAHIGAIATHTAADLAAHAAAAGATAVAAIPPIYFRVDTSALKEHYRQIAAAAPNTPLWLYNIPGATGVTITSDIFAELLNIPQIAGIKYTSYDFFTMRAIVELGQERDITVLSGPDEMCLPALTMGAMGAIGTTYNILPNHYAQLFRAYQAGDLAEAQRLQYQANRVIKAFTSVPSIAAIKEILARMGLDCGVPRRPLRPLTPDESTKLWHMLDQTEFSQLAGIPSR
ncbi:MAG: dihydrodipicolinate synthase family protein [Chloroflexota bacterium]